MSARTILIMAGGTGGHIFPALSVADELRQRGWKVIWLGARGGMEARIVSERGYPMAWISFSGVRGKGMLRALLLPLHLIRACFQSARAIFVHRPDVVLGMGGYVAFPGGMMASLLARPLVIHEQNSIAGLTNRLLARFADRVCVAFPKAFGDARRVTWTGNPVRGDITAIPAPESRYAGRQGPLSLLVIGGSLGAQALNETVPAAMALIPKDARPHVTHQSGAAHIVALRQRYDETGVEARVMPFIDDMAAEYAKADVVICRAGATTVCELAAAGIPGVMVPFPHAVDDHQTHNARFLSEPGAGILVTQSDLTPERLASLVGALTREGLLGMASLARERGKPKATQAVADLCMELAA